MAVTDQLSNGLPKELTGLVNQNLELLGRAIRLYYGVATYREVERVRSSYKEVRTASTRKKLELHRKVSKNLEKKSIKEKLAIAHSFTVSLELINLCENAYRSFRLSKNEEAHFEKNLDPIIFVLTAHPTESRNAKSIAIINRIFKCLRNSLENGKLDTDLEEKLFHLILLLLKSPISKTKSPTVQDEAEYIYSTLLTEENLNKLIHNQLNSQPVYIRTWVGGDKDGHPGIDDKVMLKSLSLSRNKLLPYINKSIEDCEATLGLVSAAPKPIQKLRRQLLSLKEHTKALRSVAKGDGVKLKRLYKTLEHIEVRYEKIVGVASPELKKLKALLAVFPGLVVPLEIREDSEVIAQALKKPNLAIAKMLKALREVAKGAQPEYYARGLVISMCESSNDIFNAMNLMQKTLKSLGLPVVPLFETRSALENSSQIIKAAVKNSEFKKALNRNWNKKMEVMLGYSDSAKESGALYSRVTIHKTLSRLDRQIRSLGYTPVFFHGSGGSVARGGGSLNEQLSWWPNSARKRFKATIQGEMIHRSFSSPEILQRKIDKIRLSVVGKAPEKADPELLGAVRDFAEKVRLEYRKKVQDEDFMAMVSHVTPYPFLDRLKIGSRPSKRKAEFNLNSLRAIPWVLCWTQTRALFPIWWGVGTSWKGLEQKGKAPLKKAFQKQNVFKSFVRLLAYSMAKVDLSVWAIYLEKSDLTDAEKALYLKEFERELSLTQNFIEEVSGQKLSELFPKWLSQSIQLRSTLIYPLNLLEIEALQAENMELLRESVTGVASGMLTTG